MCVERCILGISLAHEAKLKRMLAGYPVEISIKGGRHQPVRLSNKGGRHQPVKLSNKGGKHLTSSSLGIRPLCWKSHGLGRIKPHPCGSCDLYTVQLECYKSLALI